MDQNDLEALLATLRQAQDAPTVQAPAPAQAEPPGPPPEAAPPTAQSPVPSQSDLESLLSTLRALPGAQHPQAPAPETAPPPQPSRGRDLTKHSFQESLPILNALALDPAFLDKIEAIWDEQKNWELRMKDERNRLVLELKRSAISPVAQSQKLREWDRALQTRWVKLQHEQQEQLKSLGVPTFHRTTEPTLLKRQERLIEVLVGFLEDREENSCT